ncbi:hypothetical protein B0H10DRAFT_1231841 [Mycena sp. CBHHK59/15]|nr:hypothetical protein B0H10DRAFT_1231841 [Mycena sp. CBHHK59/15]
MPSRGPKFLMLGALGVFSALILSRLYLFAPVTDPIFNIATSHTPNPPIIVSAIQRAQRLESWLDDESLLPLIEILEANPSASESYSAIEQDGIRVKWVRRKLGMQ